MTEVTTQATRFPVIDPTQLGLMEVLETISTEAIIKARMAKFVELWAAHDPPSAAQYDVDSLEFDPIKIIEENQTYFELMLRDRVNQAARAVTLAFGTGTDLDAIATRFPGGVPRQSGETDAAYRRRVWLSPNALSPFGMFESYAFWALSAGAGLRDASATTSPGTGVVNLYIMSDDGAQSITAPTIDLPTGTVYSWTSSGTPVASASQVELVYEFINVPTRKALTDVVRVSPCKVAHVKYDIQIWLFSGADQDITMTALLTKLVALVESNRWIGVDHTIMAIEGCLAQNGVYNAKIVSPAVDAVVGTDGCIKVDSITLTYKGRGE